MPTRSARLPAYARTEIARLVPGLELHAGKREVASGRRREAAEEAGGLAACSRLFLSGAGVAGRGGRPPRRFSVVVDDVHWADTATLDCLTYLLPRARDAGAVTLVATCRGDEAPLDEHVVAGARARPSGPVEEIGLGPLKWAEAGENRSPRWRATSAAAGWPMRCSPARRARGFTSPSSWSRRRWRTSARTAPRCARTAARTVRRAAWQAGRRIRVTLRQLPRAAVCAPSPTWRSCC